MLLRDEEIEEFKELYEEEYGEVLSTAEARTVANRVLELYKIVARPLPEEVKRPLEGNTPACRIMVDDER